MKTLSKLVGLIFLAIFPFIGKAQIQIVYPNNSSFDYPGVINGVPNHIPPPLWNRIDPNTTPDVSTLGIPNYGFFLSPEFNSSDGGQWLRSIDLPAFRPGGWREGVYTTVSGLVIGREYFIKFEQAIVGGQIHQNGRWRVSLGNQNRNAPWLITPTTPYSMSQWQNVSLGPFTATATSMTIKVEARAQNQNVLGQWDGCDLALDGIYLEGFNTPPVLNNQTLEICEETSNNFSVVTLAATDPDVNDVLTYSFVSGNTGGAFSINPNTGEIKVADASKLDPDIKPTYNLIVEVNDGYGGKDQATITIQINETPEFTTSKTDITCITLGGIVITPTKGIAPFQYSVDGGVTFQGSNTFTNLPAGDYDVIVKDSKTCMGANSVTIQSIAPFTVDNVSTTEATCKLGGSVTFTVSGGTNPIEYSINNGVTWQSTNTFSDLPVGTYTITIKDDSRCVVKQQINITPFPAVVIDSIFSSDITCSVGGSIIVHASTGAASIEYSKDAGLNWQVSNIFSGLGSGTYNIHVRDANDCIDSETIQVNSVPSFTVDSINTTNETCGGGGSISIFAINGTPPLEYSIDDGSNYQLSNSFGALTGGVYKVKVKDANGCEFKQNITVNTTPPFTLDGIVTDVTCAGLGTITVNISSPTATMEYSVDGGLTFQESNFFSGLIAKDYDIVVRDFNTCAKTQTVTVNNIPPFTVDTIISIDETCFDKGSIKIVTTGGTDPVKYSIDGGITFHLKDTFNNLDPGSYDIVIKDDNTCTYTETRIIKNATVANIDSITVVNDSCNACQGEIIIHATGPGVLDYSIDNGTNKQTSNKFPGLCAGDFDILITTGTCNTPNTAKVLNVGIIADASIAPVGSVCVTNDAFQLNPNTTGGHWSGNGVDPVSGIFNPKDVEPGTHKIIYTIGGACGNKDSINITIVDTLNPKINDLPPMCITEDTIKLSAQLSGGIWSGNGVDPTGIFDPKLAGTGNHTVYYTISGICTDIDSSIIQVKDTINPEIEAAGPFCIDGIPVKLVSPNLDGIWTGNGIDSSGIFDPTKAGIGTHKIAYSISGVCVDSDTILVEVVDTLNPIISNPGYFCFTDETITLSSNIKGGIWTGTGIIDSINGVFNTKTAGSGEHIVTYQLTGVCAESTSTKLIVKQPLNITFVKPSIPSCLYADSLELMFEVNGTGLDAIEWNFGDNTPYVFNKKQTLHLYKGWGSYNGWLKITDTVCNLDTVINFNIELKPVSKLSVNPAIANSPIKCAPYLGQFLGDSLATSHFWDFGDQITSNLKDPEHFYENTGQYIVTYIASNPNYCIQTDTVKLNVDVLRNKPLWNAASLVAPEPCSYFNGILPIQLIYAGVSTDSLVIDWGDGTAINSVNWDSIYIKQGHTYVSEGNYTITIKAFDNLCDQDTTIYIPVTHKSIVADDPIMAPNIFTPNKDGVNEEFKLFYHNRKDYDIYQDILDYELHIFDRWGNQIYHSNKLNLENGDQLEHWDGTINSGNQATDGVYFFIVTYRAQCYDDGNKYKIRSLKGHITIQR